MWLLSLVLLLAGGEEAPWLTLRLETNGRAVVRAAPGESLPFEVVGELEPSSSPGLASFRFDVTFDGGPLAPLEPGDGALDSFRAPRGIGNPSGFGGTPRSGALVQVGGAQSPGVELIGGVAAHEEPSVLARGTLVAPEQTGTYRIELSDAHANAIRGPSGPDAKWSCVAVAGVETHALVLHVGVDAGASPPTSRRTARSPLDLIREGRDVRGAQPRMGEPLPGLSPEALARFRAGRAAFERRITNAEGRGPSYNEDSCATCHSDPAPGGFGTIRVVRFGRKGPPFDPLVGSGGSLLQIRGIHRSAEELVPPEADVAIHRITPHLFGAGLVDRIPDEVLLRRAERPAEGLLGLAQSVLPFEGGEERVGRFGWKSQLSSLRSFTADAALNEMGLTSRYLPEENAPNGDLEKLARYDKISDPEDRPDEAGDTHIDRWFDFQEMLAPPPQTPRSGMMGEEVFQRIGCATCHVASYVTPPEDEPAFDRVPLRPYSDFLLHDMGALGDGIVQGRGAERWMRTMPLWGVGQRKALLHDGSATGPSFDANVRRAVAAHDGEAAGARAAFQALDAADGDALVRFLGSLGRVEFDVDNDNDVDMDDWTVLKGWITGPQPSLAPDDPASIADVDADGDFDLADLDVLLRVIER